MGGGRHLSRIFVRPAEESLKGGDVDERRDLLSDFKEIPEEENRKDRETA